MSKKILTLEEQKHIFVSMAQAFEGMNPEEVESIIKSLGLDQIIGEDGELIPVYSVDITTDKPTFVTKDYDMTLTGKFYNYFADFTDKVDEWRWTRDSGNPTLDTAWNNQQHTDRILKITKADYPDSFDSKDIKYTLTAKIKNKTVSDVVVLSRSQQFSSAQIKASASVFVDTAPDKIQFEAETDFKAISYRWFINDVFASSSRIMLLSHNQVEPRKAVIVKLEAVDAKGAIFTDTMAIPRMVNGSDGEPGVEGPPGNDGRPSYTWIKYADDENGLNMNEYPLKPDGTPREYIGMATNKVTPIESNNPNDYVWSKYIGDQGIPGKNGYMWLKYSEYSTGRDSAGEVSMSDLPYVDKPDGSREPMVYLGIAYNKQVQQESMIPEDYLWSKIRGEDGHTNYLLDLSNDNTSVPALADGSIPNPAVAFSTAKTSLTLFYGNDIVDRALYTIELQPTSGITYTTTNANHDIQITGMIGDTESIKILAKGLDGKLLSSDTFNVVKVRNSAVYEILLSTSAVKVSSKVGQPVVLTPPSILPKILMNSGNEVKEVNIGRLTYRYIYPSTAGNDDDGTQIPINTLLDLSNDGDPIFIEFKYFHPVTNTLVDRERVPFVRDGINSTFTELRFAVNGSFTTPPSLNKTVDEPAGWTLDVPPVGDQQFSWVTKAIKYSETGKLVGQWGDPTRFSGVPGPKGPPGDQGAPGQASELFMAPMGAWRNDVAYIGNSKRIEAVTYQNKWYTTRVDAGVIPAGTLPTNTDYWNPSDNTFNSIATGLFLAQLAWIDNLGVNNLKTAIPSPTNPNPKRIEITGETNSMKFFVENSTQPNIQIDAIPGFGTAGGSTVIATIYMKGIAGDGSNQTTSVSTDGIIANGGNTTFISASAGMSSATSVAGITSGQSGRAGQFENEAAYAGVAGMNSKDDMYGINFGGYFSSTYVGGYYHPIRTVEGNGMNQQLTRFDNTVIAYLNNGNGAVTLPRMATLAEGWKTGAGFTITIINVNARTLTINAASGNQIFVISGSGSTGVSSANITNRGKAVLVWDGNAWHSV